MSIKNLFLFACLLAATSLGANNAPLPLASPTTVFIDGGLCNLPAPFNFSIVEVGTTWAKYSWGGSPLYEYRIRTYRASDNALLKTTNVPPGNLTAIVDGLPTGTEIYGIINAVCTDGSNSPNEAQSAPRSTLILELLVTGYNPPGGDITCTLGSSGGSCSFSSNPAVTTTFKITRITSPYSSRIFGMNFLGNTTPLKHRASFKESNDNDASLFDFKCSSTTAPDCEGNVGEIYYIGGLSPVKIATFSTSLDDQTISSFSVTALGSDYKIDRLGTYEFSPSGSSRGQTVAFSSTSSGIATASPNPFSESLDVYTAQSTAEQVTLQLFNLSGQKVLDQQFTGGQGQYTLSTAGLSPGFYLLRVEADGEVQTLKVIKSE